MASLVAFCFVLFASFAGGPIVSAIVGHNGFQQFPYATHADLDPVGVWSRVPTTAQVRLDEYGNLLPPPKGTKSELFVLGADGPIGRDELIRLLDGLRTSLEIALGAVIVALVIALPIGAAAGYFGGAIDAVVSQFTETFMAFPLLLFQSCRQGC